jgi:uncharacterized coiled-coil DUF342 family protein
MWEIRTTLTDEAQNASLTKAKELSFDLSRGIIPLEESFINLSTARSLLLDAIEKRKLIQLPITVQKNLLTQLEEISKFLTGLTSGADEVVNLINSIEALNTAMWQYGLYNLSDEILGYLNKMNQLKNLELEITRLKGQLEQGMKLKADVEALVVKASEAADELQKTVKASLENANSINENLKSTNEVSQNAAAVFATIQQNESTSTQLLSASKASNAEILALEPKIKDFYSQIDQYRTKITSTTQDAQSAIEKNEAETNQLVLRLGKLEDQIKDQIQKATGHSLFHSFQTRQTALAKSKRLWIAALVLLVLASLAVSVFVITTTTDFNVAFYLKLSMNLPLIYAIAFCTVQYSRERKLEEEYAFKSNISISLIPYQELVEKLVDKQQPQEKEKYTTFIIDSIGKVFTSPTEKIFDTEEKPKVNVDSALKQLSSAIEKIVKPLEPLLKAIKH